MTPQTPLAGCVALVTGGANGIGRSLCLEVARRGGQVVVADVELTTAESLAAEIRAGGHDAMAVHCDVTSRDSVEAARSAAVDRFGRVNLMCSNAGVIAGGPLEATRENDMRWMYEVNVFGSIRCAQVFLPLLKEAAGRGEFAHLLFTGSENSLGVPPAVCSVYTSTKHAVLGVADALRRDLRKANAGVGVTVVCPAVVNTELWSAARNRPEAWGGPKAGNLAARDALRLRGNSPDGLARVALDGCEAGEFMLIPHPEVESFTRERAAETLAALELGIARAARR